jgi:hypothetical protein
MVLLSIFRIRVVSRTNTVARKGRGCAKHSRSLNCREVRDGQGKFFTPMGMARRALLGNAFLLLARTDLRLHGSLKPDWARSAVSRLLHQSAPSDKNRVRRSIAKRAIGTSRARVGSVLQTVIDLHYIPRKIALGRWCKGTHRLATFRMRPKTQVRRLPAPPRAGRQSALSS